MDAEGIGFPADLECRLDIVVAVERDRRFGTVLTQTANDDWILVFVALDEFHLGAQILQLPCDEFGSFKAFLLTLGIAADLQITSQVIW